MILIEKLKEMCKPPGEGKSYYRPLICKGDLSKIDIFLVGTNPATPIFPEDMDLDHYVKLLLDYKGFIDYYKSSRVDSGKDEISRTRIGMNSFVDWLSTNTNVAIGETEVIPYPTANLKLLKKEPKFIIDRGKEMFYQLVIELQPRMIILHGKKTVVQAFDIFERKGLVPQKVINYEESIKDMEERGTLIQFNYSSGKEGIILACRHFMYYGSKGNSFRNFRERLLGSWSSIT